MGGAHLTSWNTHPAGEGKYGHIYNPLQAITLVGILPVESREGVMDDPNIDGFEPLLGPIKFFPSSELPLYTIVYGSVIVEAGVHDSHVGELLPNRPEVRLSST